MSRAIQSYLAHIGWLALVFQTAWMPCEAQRYLVRTYTVQDGLPSANVSDIAQDSAGRMWFLTRSGLVAYDGYEWSRVRFDPLKLLPDYTWLALDERGRAWMASHSADVKLTCFDGSAWRTMPSPALPPVDVGHSHVSGLEILPGGDEPRIAVSSNTSGLHIWDRHGWKTLADADGLLSAKIHALALDGSRLLIGTERGLSVLEGESIDNGLASRMNPPSPAIHAISVELLPGGSKRIWFVGNDWVGKLEGGERFELLASGFPIPRFGPPYDHICASADMNGGLYFGGTAGVYYIDGRNSSITRVGTENGLLGEGAASFFLDREQNLWVAGLRGVSRLTSRAFASYGQSIGLLEDEVTAILQHASGEIVFGHNFGLSFIGPDGVRSKISLARGDLPPGAVMRVLDLAFDGSGNLWAACNQAGLARLDRSGRLTWHGGELPPDTAITSVRQGVDGQLWAGTTLGLFKVDDGRLIAHSLPAELGRQPIRRVLLGRDGDLYLATISGGLIANAGTVPARFMSEGIDHGNEVFAFLEDSTGRRWAGTNAGLLFVSDGALKRPPEEALRIDRPVYSLAEDKAGRMWIGTDYGVFVWDSHSLRHLTASDGLAGHEANRAALMVDDRARVWIGTDRGASCYDAQFERRGAAAPALELVRIDAAGSPHGPHDQLALSHRDNDLMFQVRGISFIDESRVAYRYMLEGLERDWTTSVSSTHLECRYNSLSPGRYRFLITASAPGGAWSPVISSSEITISMPYWRQDWFSALLITLSAAALLTVLSYAGQRRYSKRLEREVADRTSALAEERGRLAVTLGSIADGVISVDRSGTVLLLNRAAETLTGWAAAEAQGQPLARILPLRRKHEDRELDIVGEIMKPGTSTARLESLHSTRRDGLGWRLELTASAVREGDGTPHAVVLAFRDVSQRLQMEAEAARTEKLEALGILSGGIAHDFNNILTVALGNVSLAMASAGTDGRMRPRLEDAEAALRQARDLARQLLTFSKGGTPVTTSASLAELLRESARFVLSGSNVLCEMDIADDLSPARVDVGQASQVFNNLLINAKQAMPAGGVVRVEARNREISADDATGLARGRYVCISIADDGCGIPPEVLPRVFDPYFTTKSKGSGLGLATAFSIMKNHGGLISVESTVGTGTTFDLCFPSSDGLPDERRESRAQIASGRGRVLIMDDEEPIRNVLAEIIEQLGYEAECVANGQEAIDRCDEAARNGRQFDVLVLDLTIRGGMGGLDAMQILRSKHPQLKAIASSGYSTDPVFSSHEEFGFAGVLAKPYEIADVSRVLAAVSAARPA